MDDAALVSSDALSRESSRVPSDAVPRGFRFAAVRAGIKPSGKPDFACAVSDTPAIAAAMFTSNRVLAAPVIVGQRHLQQTGQRARATIVNAGNANCATGEEGIHAAQQVCAKAAEQFGCDAHEVIPSSTGVIGVPLPAGKLIAALPELAEALGSSEEHFAQMAHAMMTTDTRPKTAHARVELGGETIRLAGMAKGAGMIFPRLQLPHATMLVYLFTDAPLDPAHASRLLAKSVEASFNRISIDGDTSTNDTVLLLANGASGVRFEAEDERATSAIGAALDQVCLSLAKQIVADGEGIGHVVELDIRGALSDADALTVARAIAHSPLVKTAWAGCDPNWGRLLAAIGYAGVPVDPALISIRFGDLAICERGMVSPDYDQAAAHSYLQQHDLVLHIELNVGQGSCRFWTTDLSTEYVRINAEYST